MMYPSLQARIRSIIFTANFRCCGRWNHVFLSGCPSESRWPQPGGFECTPRKLNPPKPHSSPEKHEQGTWKHMTTRFLSVVYYFKSLTMLMKAEASGAHHHAVEESKGFREVKKTFPEITYRLELLKDKWSGQNCLKGCFIFFCPLFVLMAPTRMIFDWVPPGGDSDVSGNGGLQCDKRSAARIVSWRLLSSCQHDGFNFPRLSITGEKDCFDARMTCVFCDLCVLWPGIDALGNDVQEDDTLF